jgi:hypothetical protein
MFFALHVLNKFVDVFASNIVPILHKRQKGLALNFVQFQSIKSRFLTSVTGGNCPRGYSYDQSATKKCYRLSSASAAGGSDVATGQTLCNVSIE